MECLRDIHDFIDDAKDRDAFDSVILRLPAVEKEMTMLLRQLRALIDAAKVAQRRCRYATQERCSPSGVPIHPSRAQSPPISWDADTPQCPVALPLFALGHNLDTNWIAARQRGKYSRGRSSTTKCAPLIAPAPAPQCSERLEPREVEIAVSTNMFLRCIEIPDIGALQRDGILYYIPRTHRFAIRLAGFVLQGNIGIVYVSESSPQKIHDCDMQPSCNPSVCRYYHNPCTCPGSTDIRNFAATSWLYHSTHGSSASNSGNGCGGPKKTRKLSSRIGLDSDILTITGSDLSYYNEQLMHDILCGIIMNYYVRKD